MEPVAKCGQYWVSFASQEGLRVLVAEAVPAWGGRKNQACKGSGKDIFHMAAPASENASHMHEERHMISMTQA